jgi:hypothetical protein
MNQALSASIVVEQRVSNAHEQLPLDNPLSTQ